MGVCERQPRGVLPAGTQVGRYELLRRLARGGMAELYLARVRGIAGFEKLVVVKLVLPHLVEDREFVDMFLAEARLAAGLDHLNVVHVIDIGHHRGEPFFVMEYVHGQDFRALLRATAKLKRRIPLACALYVCASTAAGLHYLHERRGPDGQFLGLVHRDISPANVMVGYDGGVKLVDFGIAKATQNAHSTRTGILKGKANYMAPEQCHGRDVDRRTDVFSLGILLYESTTGHRLFAGENEFYTMSRIVRGIYAHPREVCPDYPPDLETIVMRALAAEPDDRHASAAELLRDIERFAHEHRVQLSAMGLAEHLRSVFGEQLHPNDHGSDDEASPTMIHADASSAPGSAWGHSSARSSGRLHTHAAGTRRRVSPASSEQGAAARDDPSPADAVHDTFASMGEPPPQWVDASLASGRYLDTAVGAPWEERSDTEIAEFDGALLETRKLGARTARWIVATLGTATALGLGIGAYERPSAEDRAQPAAERTPAPAPTTPQPEHVAVEAVRPAVPAALPPTEPLGERAPGPERAHEPPPPDPEASTDTTASAKPPKPPKRRTSKRSRRRARADSAPRAPIADSEPPERDLDAMYPASSRE